VSDAPLQLVANWKMALGVSESGTLAVAVAAHRRPARVAVTLAPSFPALPAVCSAVAKSTLTVAAQNASADPPGPQTGEVSLAQLRELGVKRVILGHSERRSLLGETDAMVGRKVTAALREGVSPILCVGETADERRSNRHVDIVRKQLTAALERLRPPFGGTLITVAYEPVWAIGTGIPIGEPQAAEMLAVVRQRIVDLVAPPFRGAFTILYGGSVDAENLAAFVGPGKFDGTLVGSASQRAETLLPLIDAYAHL
jgi:triosephosphate isomerase